MSGSLRLTAIIVLIVVTLVALLGSQLLQTLFLGGASAATVAATDTASTTSLVTVADFTHELAALLAVGADADVQAADGGTFQLATAFGGTAFWHGITTCLAPLGTLRGTPSTLTEVLLQTGLVRSSCLCVFMEEKVSRHISSRGRVETT